MSQCIESMSAPVNAAAGQFPFPFARSRQPRPLAPIAPIAPIAPAAPAAPSAPPWAHASPSALGIPVLSPLEHEPQEWTAEEIVPLHWRLLQDVRALSEPSTALDEKLSTLRWIVTEPDKHACPFSFVSCVRIVGCSPLSPIAYRGRVDSQAIRDHVAGDARRWLAESLPQFPAWVAQALAADPARLKADLFAAAAEHAAGKAGGVGHRAQR